MTRKHSQTEKGKQRMNFVMRHTWGSPLVPRWGTVHVVHGDYIGMYASEHKIQRPFSSCPKGSKRRCRALRAVAQQGAAERRELGSSDIKVSGELALQAHYNVRGRHIAGLKLSHVVFLTIFTCMQSQLDLPYA